MTNRIGMKYEIYRAIIGSDTRAKNAVVEPMGMRAKRAQITPTMRRAFCGIPRFG